MAKKKIVIETKYTAKGADDVEDAYEGIADSANDAAKATEKVNTSMKESKAATALAESGLGGVINSFKALATNPILLVLTALVGAFIFIKDAIAESEEASNALAQGFAFLEGIIQPLKDGIVGGFMLIVDAVKEPGKAWDAFVTGFEASVNYVNDNILQPYLSTWKIIGLGIYQEILKMRLAWNEFTGDVEESDEIQTQLDGVKEKIDENVKIIKDAAKTIATDVVDATKAVVKAVGDYVEATGKAADASLALKTREQELLKVRRQQEVDNANAIANIEKLKQLRDDESLSFAERIEANKEIARVETERVRQATNLANAELQLIKDNIAAKGASTELLDAQKEKEIELADLKAENAGIETEQIVNANGLKRDQFQQEVDRVDRQLELDAIGEESAVKLAQAKITAEEAKIAEMIRLGIVEKGVVDAQNHALLLAKKELIKAEQDADKTAAEKKAEQDILDDDKAKTARQKEFDDTKDAADALIDLADALSTAISSTKLDAIDSEQAALDKALEDGLISEEEYNKETEKLAKEAAKIERNAALVKIAVDTAMAISSLVAASSANPTNAVTFGAAGAIQFAAGIVGIAANIASAAALLKAPAPSASVGGGASAPSAPTTAQTAPDLGFQGRSAGAEQFGSQIIRAYVSETDITTSQQTASNIQQLSQIS